MGFVFIKSEEIIGRKFGMLTIIQDLGMINSVRMVVCRCDCGVEKQVRFGNLSRKKRGTNSCGCVQYNHVTRHGLRYHDLYTIWRGMKQRCYYKKSVNYADYGGRGISVCSIWRKKFKPFYDWCISHGWKKGLDLDREDNDGNYTPDNCRFVTRLVGSRNTRMNVWIEYKGQRKVATDWANEIGIPVSLLLKRIKKKWPLEKAMSNIMYKRNGDPMT